MHLLPPVARFYVLAVVAAGAWLVVSAIAGLHLTHPAAFGALMLLAVLSSIFKIAVPMPASFNAQPLNMSLASQ